MALVSCPECNKEISDTAAACPGCGAPIKIIPTSAPIPQKKKTSGCAWTALGFSIFFIGLFVVTGGNIPTSEPSRSPEESLRHNRTVVAGSYVKNTLRDPDSIKWEKLLANKNATIICIKYQAKNGLGILVREYAVFHNGTPKPGAGNWNRYCVNNEMFNMALAKYDIN